MGRGVTAIVLVAVLAAGVLTHAASAPLAPSTPSIVSLDVGGDLPSGLPPVLVVVLGALATFAVASAPLLPLRSVALPLSSRGRAPPPA